MTEIWRDIKGFEGLYQVSNLGRVKSLNYKRTGKERVLKGMRLKRGYLGVSLCKDGVLKTFYIHRLVAEAFIPKVEGKEFIDHINADKTDNRVENLRWTTHKENCNNPLTAKRISEALSGENNPFYGRRHTDEAKRKMSEARKGKFGAENNSSKPIVGINKETGEEVVFAAAMEAQRVLGINDGNICECCKGKRKSAGGYYWRYA